MENLQKLKQLAEKVNERYLNDLNDDDQLKELFDFSKRITDAFVVVGYDQYGAISLDQLINAYKKTVILIMVGDLLR